MTQEHISLNDFITIDVGRTLKILAPGKLRWPFWWTIPIHKVLQQLPWSVVQYYYRAWNLVPHKLTDLLYKLKYAPGPDNGMFTITKITDNSTCLVVEKSY